MLSRNKFLFYLIVVGSLFYFIAVGLILTVWALPSNADYYDGKTITVLMGGTAGSGLDINARFFSKSWEKHFPGKTKLIVKNMPGAGGAKALNYLYRKARPDGLTVYYGIWNPMGIVTNQPGIRYKIEELKSVGASKGYFVSLVRADVSATPTEIVTVKKLKIGGINPTLGMDNVSQMSLDMLGVKYRYVSGYRGMPKIKTALLTGEVDFATTGYAGYRNFFKDTSLKSGKLIMTWYHPSFDQDGNPVKSNIFPGVKSFIEVYESLRGGKPSGPLFEAYRYITNLNFKMINNVIAPPNTREDALAILRKTYRATYKDPAFQESWEKQYGARFSWMDGEAGQKLFNAYKDISPEAVEILKKYKTVGLR